MTDNEITDTVIGCLNRAFEEDPGAIHALICNRVPCNMKLAEDPTVVVEQSPVIDKPNIYTVGLLGMINGILGDLEVPMIAVIFSSSPDANGRRTLLGFCKYRPPEQTLKPAACTKGQFPQNSTEDESA